MRRLTAIVMVLAFWAGTAAAQSAPPIGSGSYGYSALSVAAGPSGEVYVTGSFPGLPFPSLVRFDSPTSRTAIPSGPVRWGLSTE